MSSVQICRLVSARAAAGLRSRTARAGPPGRGCHHSDLKYGQEEMARKRALPVIV